MEGQSATIACQFVNSTSPVNWICRKNTDRIVYICNEDRIDNAFVTKYSIDVVSDGSRHLTIRRVDVTDAGIYECIEDRGFGPGIHRWNFTVRPAGNDPSNVGLPAI